MIVTLPDSGPQEIGEGPCTVEEILLRFSLCPDEVIVSINGRIVPEDAIAAGGDRIRILRIAHGG